MKGTQIKGGAISERFFQEGLMAGWHSSRDVKEMGKRASGPPGNGGPDRGRSNQEGPEGREQGSRVAGGA